MPDSTPYNAEHDAQGADLAPISYLYQGFQVRTTLIDGEPWFVASDVCGILGLTNPTVALNRLDGDDLSSTEVIDSIGRRQKTKIINESGLYDLIIRSDKPEAKPFRRWVTSEVLPSIRKTGSYGTPAVPELSRRELAMMVIAEADRADREMQARINAEEDSEIAIAVARELLPSAEAWEGLADADGDYSVRAAAQMLVRAGIKTGQNRLFATMVDLGWLDMRKQPYQSQVDNGRLCRKASYWTDPETNEKHLRSMVRVTPKGLEALLAKMKA